MFYYLKGTVAEIGQSSLVLDVNGIGFFINTSLKTISSVKASSMAIPTPVPWALAIPGQNLSAAVCVAPAPRLSIRSVTISQAFCFFPE